jgi:hypothetical protein
VRRPILIATVLVAAAALGGCSLTRSSTAAPAASKGAAGKIGVLINNLGSDASALNEADICNNIFATALKNRLNKIGGCQTIVKAQLNTISNTTLTTTGLTKGITSSSRSAIATVTSVYNGNKRTYTVRLVNQAKGGWRIAALG